MPLIATTLLRRTLTALALGSAALWAQASEGEVKKIDKAQAKVTLKHGEIKNLDMPPMTMAFKAKPAQLLDGLNEGDRVSFTADKVDGQYVVTQIKKLP
ncbi:MAG: RND transporter [Ideonella sp. MAG2]|nr:MAG: RND transporter [Ideonella sp. MAG2]